MKRIYFCTLFFFCIIFNLQAQPYGHDRYFSKSNKMISSGTDSLTIGGNLKVSGNAGIGIAPSGTYPLYVQATSGAFAAAFVGRADNTGAFYFLSNSGALQNGIQSLTNGNMLFNVGSGNVTALELTTSVDVLVRNDLVSDTYNFAADAEASDSYVITLNPAPSAYVTGMMITFTANTANTGAATLNANGFGAKTIKKLHDQDLITGDIEAGQVVVVVYDGTNFQLISQLAQ